MLFIDTLDRVEGDRVPLARSLVRGIALAPGVPVSICASEPADGVLAAELIVSPIDFDAWGDLWRLQAVLRDVPGALNRVLRVVDALGLRVAAKESVRIDSRQFHRMDLVLDARDYSSPIDSDCESRRRDRQARLNDLRDRVIEASIDHLRLDLSGEPDVRIFRLGELHDTWLDYVRAVEDPQRSPPLCSTGRISPDGQALVLQPEVLEWVMASCGETSDTLRCLPLANTWERMLRLYFPGRREHPTHLQLTYEPGPALAQLTDVLQKQFTIVCSSTSAIAGFTRLDLFVAPNDGVVEDGVSPDDARSTIRKLLTDSLAAFAPEPIERKDQRVALHLAQPPAAPTPTASVRVALPADRLAYLERKSEELERSSEADAAQRKVIIDAHRLRLRPKIFLSYSFQQEEVGERATRVMQRLGCEVVTGHRPTESTSFRQSLCEKITSSHAMVGIWTPDPDRGQGLSPWLWFEATVAEREARIPFILLIDERLRESDPSAPWDVWKDQHHTFLADEGDLERELAEAITVLQRRILGG